LPQLPQKFDTEHENNKKLLKNVHLAEFCLNLNKLYETSEKISKLSEKNASSFYPNILLLFRLTVGVRRKERFLSLIFISLCFKRLKRDGEWEAGLPSGFSKRSKQLFETFREYLPEIKKVDDQIDVF
jgi:hypothetical protein